MRHRERPTETRGPGTGIQRGERLLMLATLEDGIRTILCAPDGRNSRKQVNEDIEWLTSDDRCEPFSFLNLCESLDIDPDYVRARVLGIHARQDLSMRRAS